jgi:hypothetical protein
MTTLKIRALGLAAALMTTVSISGCYVEAGPPVVAEGYEPAMYDGYVVYYDEVGRPYYYANGAVVWVPPGAPAYAGLVAHWRAYGPAYHRWYSHYGYRYRAYRGRR